MLAYSVTKRKANLPLWEITVYRFLNRVAVPLSAFVPPSHVRDVPSPHQRTRSPPRLAKPPGRPSLFHTVLATPNQPEGPVHDRSSIVSRTTTRPNVALGNVAGDGNGLKESGDLLKLFWGRCEELDDEEVITRQGLHVRIADA